METVLIVDDSPAQREMFATLLQRHNFAVWMAEDGAEALERAQQTSPDLILLDVLMPRMNGYEACRKLKQHPLTKDIPVVICSSKTTPIDHHWGKKLGADAYIDKPKYEHQLVQTVQRVLSRGELLAAGQM